jgi:hypothetical protein
MDLPKNYVKRVKFLTDKISEELLPEILEEFKPTSVILKGSFGRGEPSFIEDSNGVITFFSDYEIELISLRFLLYRLKGQKLKNTGLKVANKYNIKIDIGGLKFSLFQLCTPLYWTLKPTVANYDIKYGSILLYGEDVRKKIPAFNPQDIPIEEGIRLIVNRIAEAMQYLDLESANEIENIKESEKLFFWINKIIIACQDAILIKEGKYHPLYLERNRIFSSLLVDKSNELNSVIPHFASLASMATEYKINPKKRYYKNSLQLWYEVIPVVEQVLLFIIKNQNDAETKNVTTIELLENFFVQSKKGCNIYQKLTIMSKFWLNQKRIIPRSFIKKVKNNWIQLIYFLILCIYFSCDKNNLNREKYFEKAQNILQEIDGLHNNKSGFSEKSFELMKQRGIFYWRSMCY